MKNWRNFDWVLIGLPILLIGFGVVMLWAISAWAPGVPSNTPIRQLAYLTLGLLAFWTLTSMDYRVIGKLVWVLYALMLATLAGVTLIGHASNGAQRWIDVGFIQLQPSEAAKLVVVLTLARFLSDREDRMARITTLLGSLIIAGVPAILVLRQPDFGTAMVIGAIWFSVAVMASTPAVYLGSVFAAMAVAAPIAWARVLHPFQRQRFSSFLNPQADPLNTGWNIIHARIAVGSGGTWGEWFSRGTQSRLDFLRTQTSDFIFSVISEQIGFAGLMVLFTILAAFLLRIARVAFMSADSYGRLVASGILAMFLFQTFVNIGMNIGLLPVTGIPLPLLSYGGSSLITSLASLGILESILIRNQKLVFSTGASIL